MGPGDDVAFEPVEGGVVVKREGERAPLRGRFARSGMPARLLEDRRREPR
jgi:hypothetical protein